MCAKLDILDSIEYTMKALPYTSLGYCTIVHVGIKHNDPMFDTTRESLLLTWRNCFNIATLLMIYVGYYVTLREVIFKWIQNLVIQHVIKLVVTV